MGTWNRVRRKKLHQGQPRQTYPRRKYAGKISPQRRVCLITELRDRDGGLCWFCGDNLGDDVTLEHLVPKSQHGPHTSGNLVLAHERCNNVAGSRPIEEKQAIRNLVLSGVIEIEDILTGLTRRDSVLGWLNRYLDTDRTLC